MKKVYIFFLISILGLSNSIKSGLYLSENEFETGRICKGKVIENNEFCKEIVENSVKIPDAISESLLLYEDSIKREIYMIYRSHRFRLKKISEDYYKSKEFLYLEGPSLEIDKKGNYRTDMKKVEKFNVIIHIEKNESIIKLYIYKGDLYSENKYKFNRKIIDSEIEKIIFFNSKDEI